MAHTKDLGPLYVHRHIYPLSDAPIVNWTITQEVEPPFRRGRTLILRLPWTRQAAAVGIFTGRLPDEDAALMAALAGHTVRAAGPLTSADLDFGGDQC